MDKNHKGERQTFPGYEISAGHYKRVFTIFKIYIC